MSGSTVDFHRNGTPVPASARRLLQNELYAPFEISST